MTGECIKAVIVLEVLKPELCHISEYYNNNNNVNNNKPFGLICLIYETWFDLYFSYSKLLAIVLLPKSLWIQMCLLKNNISKT